MKKHAAAILTTIIFFSYLLWLLHLVWLTWSNTNG